MKHRSKDRSKEQKEAAGETEQLRRQAAALQTEKDELFGRLQRVSADYANYQKRAPKQIADSIAYEKDNIIRSLLPALDNLEHTLQNADSAEDVDVLVKGIRIIYDQMLDILKLHGAEQIEAAGRSFDPAVHEAMMQEYRPQHEENIVLEEFRKGYKVNGRVIRPSRVVVNKLPPKEPAPRGQDIQAEPPEKNVDRQEHPVDECETTDTE
ncbi:MAG: nucleotide exchange factor GrpE [Planctomycetota bacterium]|jgi:molecular chaperone GrpE